MKKIIILFSIIFLVHLIAEAQGDTITIFPENPTINDSIKIITHKCGYDITSFDIANDTIILNLFTDSRIMAPCVLTYDTVNIGKLHQGEWTLVYNYIDRAISTSDSIIYSKIIDFNISGILRVILNQTDEDWKIYPNPSGNMLVIENNNLKNQTNNYEIRLSIMDMTGRELKNMNITDHFSTLSVEDLENGEYIIHIKGYSKVISKILIKQ